MNVYRAGATGFVLTGTTEADGYWMVPTRKGMFIGIPGYGDLEEMFSVLPDPVSGAHAVMLQDHQDPAVLPGWVAA